MTSDRSGTNAPRDVLIPCPLNTKRPTVKYGGGVWTWGSFDEFRLSSPAGSHDWSIGLLDLCVVDVDDHDLAVDLEARFPSLRSAPCERTRRGFHYMFRRSPLANAGSYFDGCGQVSPHLDFKSVCSTGTPGIIVVAPSTCVLMKKIGVAFLLSPPHPDPVLQRQDLGAQPVGCGHL